MFPLIKQVCSWLLGINWTLELYQLETSSIYLGWVVSAALASLCTDMMLCQRIFDPAWVLAVGGADRWQIGLISSTWEPRVN